MTSDALQRLIDAVEDEAWDGSLWRLMEIIREVPPMAFGDAYRGSLDAAMALQKTILPGWGVVNLGQAVYARTGPTVDWHCRLEGRGPSDGSYAIGIGPARALLLAILRAYQSQEASQ